MKRAIKPGFRTNRQEHYFPDLRQEVFDMVQQLRPKRRPLIIFKALFFPLLYFAVYFSVLAWGARSLILFGGYFAMGLLLVCIFLNTIHDAVHGNIFRSRAMNNVYVHLFDLMGANSYLWKLRHIRFHHNYPNVNGWDTDIEQSSLFRVMPDAPYAPFHRYQHIYLPLLYPFYLFNWLMIRDFKDFFNRDRTIWKLVNIPMIEYVKLFFFKGLYIFYVLVLPVLLLPVSWITMLGAFLVFMFTASIFSLIVLLSPHANTESEFPVVSNDNTLGHSWVMHMMKTTNDVSHDNWFTRFFMGCFNYHVAHHLFPNINHAYYPEVTGILKKYAEMYGLPYREFSLLQSLEAHYRLLKQNGVQENIFEEAM